jgi:uncharacterized protein (UPF0261 family)
MAIPKIAVLGTCDSKLNELLYVRERILELSSCSALLIDVGRNPCQHSLIDIKNADLVRRASLSSTEDVNSYLLSLSRTEYIKHMILCATDYISAAFASGIIHGVISIGGSSGTSLASAVMRDALPVGFPKLIVSTMASGDVKPYIEETDITMMYSVVDIAGTNSILNQILSNAAGAITGMALSHMAYRENQPTTNKAKRIGVTMFGVTTPCVDTIRVHLESKYGYEVYVFHATGAGGKAMERLVREKKIDALLDITTTEIADELIGGVLTAGPDRLIAAASVGIPQIISTGACDIVNFGPEETVPTKFKHRQLHEHNPAVTLMRTSPSECAQIGAYMSRQLRDHATHPHLVEVLLPTGGISILSTPGAPFHYPEADASLFTTLETELESSGIRVSRDERDINNPEFAVMLAESLVSLIQRHSSE